MTNLTDKTKTIFLCKAEPIGNREPNEVPNISISITGELPNFKSLKFAENFYENEANALADALFSCLPQGTLDRVIVRFMQRNLSLYMGSAENLIRE